MLESVRATLQNQFDAALSMLHHGVVACPDRCWDAPIARIPCRTVVYHTLFWVDYYLTPGGEAAFEMRPVHHRGGDERIDGPLPALDRAETATYLCECRDMAQRVLAAESMASLEAPCGHARRPFSRLELHLYNLRHLQHHTGQVSAFVRRLAPDTLDGALPWVGTGWRMPVNTVRAE